MNVANKSSSPRLAAILRSEVESLLIEGAVYSREGLGISPSKPWRRRVAGTSGWRLYRWNLNPSSTVLAV
jgi:hypothetical protein